jgi:hypothetical protein
MSNLINFPIATECYYCKASLKGLVRKSHWEWGKDPDTNQRISMCWSCVEQAIEIGIDVGVEIEEKE